MTRSLLGVLVVAWGLVAALTAGAVPVLAVLGTLLLFALPGWAWMRRLAPGRPLAALLVGGACGVVASAALNAGWVFLAGWNPALTALGLLALAACSWLVPRRPVAEPAPAALDGGDAAFLVVTALLLLVVVAIPLARNPTVEGDTHAYHSLMAHDYLMRGTFSVAVQRGLPPHDAFLASERMNNYCLYYSVVAFAMEATGGVQAPERFVAATDLLLPFLFLLALFAACRVFLEGRRAWVAVGLGLLAGSYNDVFVFTKYVRWSGVDRLHDFAAEYSDLSHGWYRDFLVEPHAVLALVFGFTAFALSTQALRARMPSHPSVALGVLLAGAFASDGFLGTLFVVFFGATYLARWLRSREAAWVPGPRAWLGMALPFALLAGAALATGLASAGTKTGGLTLRPYLTAIKYGVALYPIVLGPALLFALLLLLRGRRRATGEAWGGVWALAGLCLFASLFVQHSDPDFADLVLRKSMKVMRLPVILLAAAGLATVSTRRGRVVAGLLVLLAIPTLLVDVATLSGLHDRVRTSTVSQAEIDACAWIRTNTPKEAIAQGMPETHDGYYPLSPIAMFAGRAMALGNLKMARLSSPSAAAFDATFTDVAALFASPHVEDAVRILRKRGIDYVFVGPSERARAGEGTRKFAEHPDVFERVYDEDGVAIFRLLD